jgi:tetratricopeptide (TPR) repeat protein
LAEGRFSKLERKDEKGPLEPPAGTVARESTGHPQHAPDIEDQNLYPTFIEEADKEFFVGNYREALRHFSRALQQENTHVYPWIGQISALIGMKQYREAELWSQRALEQFPEDPSLLSQRARVLALTGNLKRALGVSDYAMTKGATSWAWLARGEVLLEGRQSNALFCFEKAMELADKEDWRVPTLAGLAFSRHRQWANAQDYLRQAAERNAKNFYVWYELGRVQFEMGNMDRSRDSLSRAMQLNPEFRPAKDLERMIYRRPFLKRIFGGLKR